MEKFLDALFWDKEAMTGNQVYNPFLPLAECVPDGEPHVFGDRVYIYGSHDKEGGETFCMLDYVTYSASVNDLKNWRYEGVIYKASQDPDYPERPYMYAPDVVKGNDGKYYLYYCMSGDRGQGGYFGPISVAVSDSPAGPFEYLGFVRNPDGSPAMCGVCFDPGVINDEGVIRLYYGTSYDFEEREDFFDNEDLIRQECLMFGKHRSEILDAAKKESVMGPMTVCLQEDMVTIADQPRHIIPYKVKGTSFEGHPFFEASSIRKVGQTYYFIYSSRQNHELCYATSPCPDRDFVFGGTIVSNGDVGMKGRKEEDRLNMTGTTHGSIEKIKDKWYVFYHRLTHKSDYSRQACAEPIIIKEDGSIDQVEITSCGLNGGPLRAAGTYPAPIACIINNKNMPHGCNRIYTDVFPHVDHEGEEHFIGQITDHTTIGFRYFAYRRNHALCLTLRAGAGGMVTVSDGLPEEGGMVLAQAEFEAGRDWYECRIPVEFPEKTGSLILDFTLPTGAAADLLTIRFPK